MFLKFWSYLNAFEYINFSDLNHTLEDFLEDSWKTLGRLLGKSSNAFYARRRPTKSSGSLPSLNMQIFQIWVRLWKISRKTLGRLLETIRRLLADSETLKRLLRSLLMYFMLEDFPRGLREVFQSLLSKVVQMNDVKWSPSLSMLRNDI